jgi:hypothetical protein
MLCFEPLSLNCQNKISLELNLADLACVLAVSKPWVTKSLNHLLMVVPETAFFAWASKDRPKWENKSKARPKWENKSSPKVCNNEVRYVGLKRPK